MFISSKRRRKKKRFNLKKEERERTKHDVVFDGIKLENEKKKKKRFSQK